MKTTLILFTLIIGQFCIAQNIEFIDYIGKEYRSLSEFEEFKDYEDQGGMMIEPYEGENYGFSHYVSGNTHIITYEKIRTNSEGLGMYTLIDAVVIEGISNNQFVQYGLCRINGEDNSNLIVVYESDNFEEEFFTHIISAWLVNQQSYSIQEIDVDGIDCINEGYGCLH